MKKTYNLILENLRKYVPINIFRGGQETVYTNIRDAIVKGIRTMYIEGPTGMGKSFIQSTLADAIINGSDIQVLLLVPKITLLSQMQREFVKFAKHLLLGLVGAGQKSYHNQVTVMTYQSFVKFKGDGLKRYSVLFLDEAHKALGEKTRARIEEQKHAIIIGFTATPTYSEKKNLKEFLKYEAYCISIPEAVKVGMLSAIQFIIGKVKIEISGKEKGESSQEYLNRVGKEIIRQGGNIAASKLYKKIFEKRGTRFIMFTASVDQGLDLVRELRDKGISAEIITGKMKSSERDKLFSRFSQNKFKVLVGIDTIKEGFDDPGVHGVMFAYPIGTIVGLIQGAGRSTRIDELFPNKVAYVVQLMFQAKKQVWYNDALEGLGPFVVPDEDIVHKVRKKQIFNIVNKDELIDITDEVIESVSVDHEEIFNLTNINSTQFNFYETLKEAKDGVKILKVKGFNIQSVGDYQKYRKEDIRLHSSPDDVYKSEWIDWFDFLGKKSKFYLTLKEAKEAIERLRVKGFKIETYDDYKKHRKEDIKLPSRPNYTYKSEWIDWFDFLGKKSKFYLTLKEAKEAIERLRVKGFKIEFVDDYQKHYKEDIGLPSNPNYTYKSEWIDWFDFLGKENKDSYETLKECKEAIERLRVKGFKIEIHDDYQKHYKEDIRLPSNPDNTYKSEWTSWPDFLKNKPKNYETLKEAKEAIERLRVKGFKIEIHDDYQKHYKEDIRLPSNPNYTYKSEWINWFDFLGKVKKF